MKPPGIHRLGFLTVLLGAAINRVVDASVLSPLQGHVDVEADGDQVVLRSHPDDVQDVYQVLVSSETTSDEPEWDTQLPDNSTGNFLFNSVSSLMQRWPNTYWRNGS